MDTYSYVHFGIVLRKLRNTQQLSQEALADRCSRHPSYISLLERNLKNPSLDTIVALATGLEMKASEMLMEVEQHTENKWVKDYSDNMD
ncbi:helix-turn-helix transcriptional regulator [Bacillus sp. ISL-40]|uniref:helix-turn-helix domain-containing protein n=1 Tax=unclassified Bacillus (in: firmicutes) TaxID=185979 RepID=UPI001BEC729B|nr:MULTISPECIES: helix-turn-helix transcriptional regulator [unclassified Bacillus (in: firmicutes)]MBT2701032.1 helix-turn-helix transcriptional regulator [Bacillus sp. ISL-40]MBT2739312.1 helix-turn-helix transcriptional regulator [Bacillus sp. ISL-77]